MKLSAKYNISYDKEKKIFFNDSALDELDNLLKKFELDRFLSCLTISAESNTGTLSFGHHFGSSATYVFFFDYTKKYGWEVYRPLPKVQGRQKIKDILNSNMTMKEFFKLYAMNYMESWTT